MHSSMKVIICDVNLCELAKEVYNLARINADKINNASFKEELCEWDSHDVLKGSIIEVLNKDTREFILTRGS